MSSPLTEDKLREIPESEGGRQPGRRPGRLGELFDDVEASPLDNSLPCLLLDILDMHQ